MTAAAATTDRTPHFDVRWLGEVLALAALYFLTARLGLLMAIPGAYITPVWPPSGIALAAVLLRGGRVWPGIWLGSFAANLWHFYGYSPLATALTASATIGIGASLTALLGCLLLRRFGGERNPLERVLDVCAFMALGGVVSCLASAAIGVTTLCLVGYASWARYGQAWLTWWLGDTGGVFIVAPLLLVWGGAHQRKLAAHWVELVGGFGLMIAVTYYVFCENTTVGFTGKPLTFIILIPFLAWAAVRFGQRGAATAVGLIALLAVWGTIHQTGPFSPGPRNEALLSLELFLALMALTALCLAAMVTEREHLAAARQRAVEELESHVRERTSAVVQSEAQARRHLAEAERARAALLSILEDQQRAETALRQAEEQYRSIFNNAVDGISRTSLDGKFLVANPAAARIFGFGSPEELIEERQDIAQQGYVDPRRREEFKRLIQEQGVVNGFEYEAYRKDGSRVWISENTRAVHSPSGEILYFEGIFEDVTERKQAEEALRESEERFRTIFEQAPLGISEGEIATARFVSANQRYVDILGHTIDELRTLTFKDYTHPEDLQKDLVEFQKLATGEIRTYAMKKRYIRKDGAIIWVNLTVSGLAQPGEKPLHCMAVIEDITERKQAEEQLERSAHLLQVLSRRLFQVQEDEKRHLARELHDEMGQALTAAKINLQSARSLDDPANLARRLDDSIGILDGLLQQTRRLSLDLRPPLLDDLGLVPALRSYLDEQAQRAGFRAIFFADPRLERVSPEIETACFRVAQQALTNAVRHAQARTVNVELHLAPHALYLIVRDDGAGFDVEAAEERARRGGSFGLSGMRERLSLVGGELDCKSTPGWGTEVHAFLPLEIDSLVSGLLS